MTDTGKDNDRHRETLGQGKTENGGRAVAVTVSPLKGRHWMSHKAELGVGAGPGDSPEARPRVRAGPGAGAGLGGGPGVG